MALVNKAAVQATSVSEGKLSAATTREAEAQRKKARTLAKQQQAAERIAAATGQLASGIAEASSAAEELKRASDQIATGAEEASSAAQESLAAFQQVGAEPSRSSCRTLDVSRGKGEVCQTLIAETSGDVAGLITNVGVAAQRQLASVRWLTNWRSRPRRSARSSRRWRASPTRPTCWPSTPPSRPPAPATRQGFRGRGRRGADPGRNLGEERQGDPGIGRTIPHDVKTIAEGINKSAKTMEEEVEKGKTITEQLEQIRLDTIEIVEASTEIAADANQSNVASQQAQKGAQNIAAAAEEQSAACRRVRQDGGEQTQASASARQAAQALSELAEELKNSTDVAKSAEQVASSAEELSSAVQEINRSSAQIMTALGQIRKGAEVQSAASKSLPRPPARSRRAWTLRRSAPTASAEKVSRHQESAGRKQDRGQRADHGSLAPQPKPPAPASNR